ncbi:MAG: UDP-2,3-diacylglucosamine diphosphatase [Arsenophonus sp.]|nr:MAG: UDP-2,3-diacylglucosamine diphosphatase [Arsenophonus sp.]
MILFISDLHLSESRPKIVLNFIYFLKEYALKSKALYILGDFFDYWIGDDEFNSLQQKIAKELLKLKLKKIPCYLIHGNRDFLIKKKFAKKSGLILLPEEKILKIYQYKIFLLHGDTLCTEDFKYQKYRKYTHKFWVQNFFLLLPLYIRKKILKIIKKINQKKQKKTKKNIDQKKILKIIKKYNIDYIIHGHTHQNEIHLMKIDEKFSYRIVLGKWEKNAFIIKLNNKKIELSYLKFI